MSRKNSDGIRIDSKIYLSDDKQSGLPVSIRVIQLLSIFLGSLCSILILFDSLSLPVKPSHTGIAVLVSATVFFFLFLYPRYDLVKLITCAALYLFVIWRSFPRLVNALYILENYIIRKASAYYNFKEFRYKAQYATEREDLTLFIVMLIIIITALLSAAMVRNMLTGLCYVVLIIPIAASFAIGETPREGWLIIFIIIMIYLSRSYAARQKTPFKDWNFMLQRIYSRAAIVLCLMGIVLFILSKIFVPRGQYQGIDVITNTKHDIQDFFYSFTLEDISDKLGEIKLFKAPHTDMGKGGLSTGELGRFSEVTYDGDEHLVVKVPINSITEGILLKGYVGSEYTGDSWERHTRPFIDSYEDMQAEIESEGIQPLNLSTIFMNNMAGFKSQPGYGNYSLPNSLDFYKGSIGISYKNANKDFIYSPYLTDLASSKNVSYRYDLYAEPYKKKNMYEFDYFYGISIEDGIGSYTVPESYSYMDYEMRYRRFVYEAYTGLPDKGLGRLKWDFSPDNLGTQADTLDKAVSYIKNYLNSSTEYTLAPGKLPKGEDFVEYFLYESKVGYCTHYASAGALMLRAMGYPSRYVEGYAVTASDILLESPISEQKIEYYTKQGVYESFDNQVTVSVKDYNAHAWAEVYVDGFGWFPVEFTPSAAIEGVNDIIGDIESASDNTVVSEEPTSSPEALPTPGELPEDEEPEVTREPSAEEDGEEGSLPAQANKEAETDKNSGHLIWTIIAITAVLFLLLSALICLRILRLGRISAPYNRSIRALMVYENIERLLSACAFLPKKNKCLEDNLEYVREHCPYIDAKDIEDCMEVAKKARFGREPVSREELHRVKRYYSELRSRIYYGSSIVRRVHLKLIRTGR